jgi:hypothetical protein
MFFGPKAVGAASALDFGRSERSALDKSNDVSALRASSIAGGRGAAANPTQFIKDQRVAGPIQRRSAILVTNRVLTPRAAAWENTLFNSFFGL